MDKILHDPKDPKLWELWYIPYYGSCRILSISRMYCYGGYFPKPKALRTHIYRLLCPKTILYKAFGLISSLRVSHNSIS